MEIYFLKILIAKNRSKPKLCEYIRMEYWILRGAHRGLPPSCRRACRGSWCPAAAERRRRANHRCRCTSANGPTARNVARAPGSCSCAYPEDAWPSTSSRARPDRPPDRSAPPSATAI